MTYEEFTALAKREISTTEYHEVVEPVYTYHPAIPNKETAAKLYDLCGLQVFHDITKDAGEIKKRVEIVEKWGKENPVKTRKDELLKVFPYAPLTGDGVPKICPGNVDGKRYTADKTGYNCPDSCLKCREKYWLEEVN